jgi:hypothetical protein
MGVEANSPICRGVASSSTRKLLSNTPPVILEKTVAKTPSSVEARRLARMSFFEIFVGSVGGTRDSTARLGTEIPWLAETMVSSKEFVTRFHP